MASASEKFAERLRAAMEAAGYEPKPAVLERGFNLHYLGKPMTLHGVRRWLLGESLPRQDKLEALALWLGVEPQAVRYGGEIASKVRARQQRWDEGVGHQEREVFEAFLALPVEHRKIVREVILAFVRGQTLPPR
jgi:hypothetical protein